MVRIEEWYSYWNLYLKSRKKFKTSDIESLIDFEWINKNKEIKIKWQNLTIFWRYQKEEYRIISLLNWRHYCVMSISLTKDFEKWDDWQYIIPVEFLDDFIDANLLQVISNYSLWITWFMKTWTTSIINNLVSWWYNESVLNDYIDIVQSYKTIWNQKYSSFNQEWIKDIFELLRSEKVMKKIDKKIWYMKKWELKEFLNSSWLIWVRFSFK